MPKQTGSTSLPFLVYLTAWIFLEKKSFSVILKMLCSLLLPPLYLGGGGERSEKCSREAYFNANLLLIITVLKSSQPSAEQ